MEQKKFTQHIHSKRPKAENNAHAENKEEVIADIKETPQEEVTLLQEKIKELEDQNLRALAEIQNTKRRAQLDVENARQYSLTNFAKDIVNILENLYRASELIKEEDAKNNQTLANFKEGIEITKREMINILDRNNIKRVNPINEQFNHDLHQAIAQVENNDVENGAIVDVVQAGYTLSGRSIKPALVVVAKKTEI